MAAAQARPGSVEIGVGTGRFYGGSFAGGSTCYFEDKTLVDDDQLGGFWLGAQLTPSWSLELAVRRTHSHILEARGGVFPTEHDLAVIDFSTIEALALHSFRVGNFLPYLGAGAGIASLDIDAPSRAVQDSNRPSLALAAGARFYALPWAGFRFDLRGRGVYLGARCHRDGGWNDHGRWFTAGEVMVGVFASFGGKT
jgi:opacity protein-like surface antigen